MTALRASADGLKTFLTVLLPFGAGPRGLPPKLRWALHGAALTLILAGLWLLNEALGLEKMLHSAWPRLHGVWLPLLFVLGYAALATAHWLWRLLGPGELSAAYPEIEAAWNEIRAALCHAHLDVRELPLFLVLGRPAEREENLFAAAPMRWLVRATPPGDPPLRVYASSEAIFLTCADSTALGHIAGSLDKAGADSTTLAPEELRGRLQHLCRLIARERRPYCPVNGILAVAPLRALDSDEQALRVATLLQAELTIARDTLQLECPAVLLVSDLERAPGFAEFAGQGDTLKRTLGQTFPLMPDVEENEIAGLYDRGLAWFCQNELLTDLLSRVSVDPPGEADASVQLNANIGLYRFWSFLVNARKRLARLALNSAQTGFGTAPMVGGVFLAATGADASRQAFVEGVFRRLLRGQNAVTWSPEALEDESSQLRVVRLGYLGLLMMLPALGGVGYWFWRQ